MGGDDEITEADRVWVEDHHDGPALLHRVDPRRGLAADDFAALTAWAADLAWLSVTVVSSAADDHGTSVRSEAAVRFPQGGRTEWAGGPRPLA